MAKENLGKILMTPKGAYDSTVAYEFLDIVSYNGGSYVCKKAGTGNVPTNTEYWQLIAEKGNMPVVGEDYFTEADKNEIADEVIEGARGDFETYYNSKVTEFEAHNDHIISANDDILNALPSEVASGTDINITDGKECRLINSNIKGKCIQDGTPTPTAPVEIEVNKGLVNLFNKDLDIDNFYYGDNGNTVEDSSGFINQTIEIGANKNIVISYKSKTDRANVRLLEYQEDNTFIKRTLLTVSGQTIELDVNTKYIIVSVDAVKHYFVDLMIENDTTPHKWVPYGNGLTIVSISENLFDGKTEQGTISTNDGSNSATDNAWRSVNYTEIFELTNTLTINDLIVNKTVGRMYFYDENKTYLNNILYSKLPYTFTAPANTKYIRFFVLNDVASLDSKVMIRKGTTATEYEEYKGNLAPISLKGNELYSVGDVKDELIINNDKAKIIKRIGKIVLDGTQYYGHNTTGDTHTKFVFNLVNNGFTKGRNQTKWLFSHFQLYNNENMDFNHIYVYGGNVTGQGIGIIVENNIASTLEEFKTWLSENNLTIYYELTEPVEIDLGYITDLPRTFDGTNYINVESNINDVELDIKYVQDIKAYINSLIK